LNEHRRGPETPRLNQHGKHSVRTKGAGLGLGLGWGFGGEELFARAALPVWGSAEAGYNGEAMPGH